MTKYLFLLLTAVLLLGGCSDDPSSPSTASVIMPLAVGNQWIERVTIYNGGNSVDTIYYDTLLIRDVSFYQGDSVYHFDGPLAGANRADGYYISLGNMLQILAKYPAFSGEVFRIDTSISISCDTSAVPDTTISKFMCEQVNTVVNVSAGSFTCNKYNVRSTGTYQTGPTEPREKFEDLIEYWYAPGIGQVKSINYVWSGSLVLFAKRELVSYHLN